MNMLPTASLIVNCSGKEVFIPFFGNETLKYNDNIYNKGFYSLGTVVGIQKEEKKPFISFHPYSVHNTFKPNQTRIYLNCYLIHIILTHKHQTPCSLIMPQILALLSRIIYVILPNSCKGRGLLLFTWLRYIPYNTFEPSLDYYTEYHTLGNLLYFWLVTVSF